MSCLGSSALRRPDCGTWHSGGGWSPCLWMEAPYKQADQGQGDKRHHWGVDRAAARTGPFHPWYSANLFWERSLSSAPQRRMEAVVPPVPQGAGGRSCAVPPSKAGAVAAVPPAPHGVGGRSCAVPPSKAGAVAAGAAYPSRGRWERLCRSPKGEWKRSCRLPLKGRVGAYPIG